MSRVGLVKGKVIDLTGLQIPQSGLRPESFAYLRAGGKVHGGRPQLGIMHDGKVAIYDGRHRLTLAREKGELINVVVRWYGPRGGVRRCENLVAKV